MPASTLKEPATDPVAQTLKRRIGGYAKHGNHEAAASTRRELDLHQLRKHIRRVVDDWPPLTIAERDELAALLAPGAEAVRRAS